METPLYIPTINRMDAPLTLSAVRSSYRNGPIIIVTQDSERSYWEQAYGLKTYTPALPGIAHARQAAVEHAHANGHMKLLMLDDDLYFYKREDGTSLRKATYNEVGYALSVLVACLDEYHHVCMGPRMFQNAKPAKAYERVKANNVHGFRVDTLMKHNVRFDVIPVMEDYHVTLSLLALGYENYGYYDVVWNQRESGGRGGCSGYRTADVQKEAAHRLAALHPGLVEPIRKTSKSGKDVMGNRWDVKIHWKKALKK